MAKANVSRLPVRYRTPSPDYAPPAEDNIPLAMAIKGPVRLGLALIGIFALGFGAWALTAPLAAGAVAPGIVSPDGSRRVVQHLEGGLIAAIKVRDGDLVQKGDPVIVLQSVQAAANHQALLDEYRTLMAKRARLHAELFKKDAISFPPELLEEGEDGAAELIAGQEAIFSSRRSLLEAQKLVLNERIAQSAEQVGALEAQVQSITEQLAFVSEELDGKERLFKQALVTKTEVLALQRARSDLEGQRGQYLGTIAEIGQKRGEIESQLLSLDAERNDAVTAEYDQTRVDLANVVERLNASRDILERTVVSAPVSGKVVNSRFASPGGVVLRGEPILDIVPTEEKLYIDARVSVTDIDIVHVGMPATVQLTALAAFRLPRIEGVVRSVSADRIVDQATGQAYYLARVEVPRETLASVDDGIEIVPGMPAEILIVTSERTMMEYLIEPFIAAFQRSFREA